MAHQLRFHHHPEKCHPIQDDESMGSLDITVSLSSPGPEGEVSWSSSEGSSYDTAEDLANMHLQRQPSEREKSERQLQATVTKAEATQTHSQHSSNVNPENLEKNHRVRKAELQANTPKSRLLRPFSKTNPTSHPRMNVAAQSALSHSTRQKRCVLDHVKVYSEVELASGRDDLSTVCFLSKTETDEVFSTRGIPLEIAASNNGYTDDISTVSASVNGSIVGLQGVDECCDFSQKAFHKTVFGPVSMSATKDPPSPTGNTARTTCKPMIILDDIDSVHSISMVAVSCQQTVSSLESSLTWDSQQDSNNCESNGSEDAVRGPLKPSERCASKKCNEDTDDVTSPAMKESLYQTNGSFMDDRILQLKQKIKHMQQTSVFQSEHQPLAFNTDIEGAQEGESIMMASTVSGLPTEAVTTVADLSEHRPGFDHKTNFGQQGQPCTGRQVHCIIPAHSRAASSDKEQNKAPTRLTGPHAFSTSFVPAVIPINHLEEVSLMDGDCDVESYIPPHFPVREGFSSDQEEDDKRLGEPKESGNADMRRDSSLSFAQVLQDFIRDLKLKVQSYATHLVVVAQHQKSMFDAKSKSEKVVTIFIASGILILFILLIALIA